MRLHWRLILRVYFSKLRIKIRGTTGEVIVEAILMEGVTIGSRVMEAVGMIMEGDSKEGERCLLRKR